MAIPPALPAANPLASLDVEDLILGGLELLGPLFSNGYDFKSLKYPDDIEHFFMHGHYINFYVNVQRMSKYYNSGLYSYKGNPSYTGNYIAIDAPYLPDGTLNGSTGTVSGLIQKLTTQRINQAISIYIPDSMSFSTEIGWEEFSITNKGAEAAEAMAKSFLDKVFPQWAGNPILTGAIKAGQAAGFALNPETLVLFKGIDLRTFSYTFFFSPKNEREAKSIRDIIKAFRFHAAPEINKDFGLFYIAPSTFDIDFMHRGRRNTNIHQVKTCVLTHYDVDYAPFGWSTHKDGMPIQTKLNLVFKEVEMLDKGEIENGY